MNKVQVFFLLAAPYFFLCGGLYHISFWSTFEINGLMFISISDIIKSSVYPIIGTFIFTIIGMIIPNILINKQESISGKGRNTKAGIFINKKSSITILLLIWIFVLFFYYFYFDKPSRLFIIGFIFSIAPTIYLHRIHFLSKYIVTNDIRLWVILTIILLPTLSFTAGKYKGELIYNNISYDYINYNELYPDSCMRDEKLKLIGFTDKYIFFTDIDNNTTYYVKEEKLLTIELKKKD